MQLPAILKPAHARDVKPHHVPVIPEWWPLPPSAEDGLAAPTPVERMMARRAQVLREATEGPLDGTRFKVSLGPDQRPPASFTPSGSPGTRYLLDREESTRTALVYRYDLDSPNHHLLMQAVTDGYREAGPDYTITAREENVHEDDRHAPLAYPRG